jgi:hypothetical protein
MSQKTVTSSIPSVRENSKGSHARTRPSPPCRWLTGNFPHDPKDNKGTVVNLYLWVSAKDSWADEWPNHNLSSLVATQQHSFVTHKKIPTPATQWYFSTPGTFPPASPIFTWQWAVGLLLEIPFVGSLSRIKAVLMVSHLPPILPCLSSV